MRALVRKRYIEHWFSIVGDSQRATKGYLKAGFMSLLDSSLTVLWGKKPKEWSSTLEALAA